MHGQSQHSDSKRTTVDVKMFLASGVGRGALSELPDWRQAGSEARSIVQWYRILCDRDDVDERKVCLGGWVDVSSDAKREFARS
jgi:hypothetical protein